ncbi:MAG: AAA family ATPase [Proteobacteria bacterium]|nr:AAA family ATPase [Pseudomonadota bacterium]MBU4298238.1 AAA family ATPase [Pseudomonadota bacterium]MCG2747506.1 AAA family ATPase [Desulfobulbaceae bacterium]
MKIAISGKGGVGKTTIMGLLARQTQKSGREVLVIDADPSPHMAQTLGVENIGDITPIADMKKMLTDRSGKVEGSPFYNINPKVDDLPAQYMLEKDGVKLMVLGAIQTAESGCACAENTVLKRLLTKLMLNPGQTILLDMEAGVEHLGRGTIAGVDGLLIVVIPAMSSMRTGLKIQRLARESGIPRIYFVGNLVDDEEDEQFLINGLGEKPIVCFPDSKKIRKAERAGNPITAADEAMNMFASQLLARLTDQIKK